MADLPETEQWEAGIYQIEETDPVQGGENGVSNVQAKQLANRTAWLKKQLDVPAAEKTVYLGAGQQFTELKQIIELPSRQLAAIQSIVLTDTSYAEGAISTFKSGAFLQPTFSDLSHITISQQNDAPVDCHNQYFAVKGNVSSPIFDFDMTESTPSTLDELFFALGSAKITVAPNRSITLSRALFYVADNAAIDMPLATVTHTGTGNHLVNSSIAYNFRKAGTVNISGSSFTRQSYNSNQGVIDLSNIKQLQAREATFNKIGFFIATKVNDINLREASFTDTPIHIDSAITQLQNANISFPSSSPATPLALKGTTYLTNATGDFSALTLNTPSATGIIYG